MRTLIFLLTLFLSLLPADAASDRSPNIIVVFMDDMGYADIGPFGAKAYPTPNFDRMAMKAVLWTSVTRRAAPRGGLLTGITTRVSSAPSARATRTALTPRSDPGNLQTSYATACFGKWHLGHHKKLCLSNMGSTNTLAFHTE